MALVKGKIENFFFCEGRIESLLKSRNTPWLWDLLVSPERSDSHWEALMVRQNQCQLFFPSNKTLRAFRLTFSSDWLGMNINNGKTLLFEGKFHALSAFFRLLLGEKLFRFKPNYPAPPTMLWKFACQWFDPPNWHRSFISPPTHIKLESWKLSFNVEITFQHAATRENCQFHSVCNEKSNSNLLHLAQWKTYSLHNACNSIWRFSRNIVAWERDCSEVSMEFKRTAEVKLNLWYSTPSLATSSSLENFPRNSIRWNSLATSWIFIAIASARENQSSPRSLLLVSLLESFATRQSRNGEV